MRPDLTQQLVDAMLEHREQINSSRIAYGEAGRIEIHVNPAMCSIRITVLLEVQRAA